ncbi:AGE family epimerase/isomerase [Rhizobium sp. PL01]|uniref:AGE family epimerase/isomerase n=1 Tax=Rhizobium sp. PL01 TaxID=3085631 RepID=UPI0029817E65|nr:AGE family epimerase/isomerase [Rhizobium sp. PL01]MDW5315996.1 AGE family epimerase/isomerase [Rhizobium sp. PL01]
MTNPKLILADEAKRASNWLTEIALPLWADRGFDGERGTFQELLDFSLRPIIDVPLRLMVQARQISVFASAAVSGRFPEGGGLALRAAENMISRYEQADGNPGWVFAIDRNGSVDFAQRDLYAHAFVLFSLSWALRLEPRQSFKQAIDRTLSFLDDQMADPISGGYWDSMPKMDKLRRQNPHMHLFEAFISLYEATGDAKFLDRCDQLYTLAVRRFLAPESGALRETFHADWSVWPSNGEGSVEPGHLFEWSWLISRYKAVFHRHHSGTVDQMMRLAIGSGLDVSTGRVIDQIREDGRSVNLSSRSWPHAEALKALSYNQNVLEAGENKMAIAAILSRIMTLYCKPSFGGGWQDQLDDQDQPIRKDIPASTLYHIYFAICAVDTFVAIV